MTTLTFKEAARTILEAANEPLSPKEIARRALDQRLIETSGKTPDASIGSMIAVDMARKGPDSVFVRTAPGVFGLRAWLARPDIEEFAAEREEGRIRVPHYPVYAEIAALVKALEGASRAELVNMTSAVHEQRGTPQDQVDWSDPDAWIEARLDGPSAAIARRIWVGTQRVVNPRHVQAFCQFVNRFELMAADPDGLLRITERGRAFLDEPEGGIVQEIDVQEGLDRVLGLVAELGPAGRADLVTPFASFARTVSGLRADSTIQSFLWARLRNLLARGLVEREGRNYSATPKGLAWLAQLGDGDTVEQQQENDILQLIRARKEQVREEIAARLSAMDPFAFEFLVKALLEAMDYDDVEVTSKSGDGGVDVTARIELGITEVREVVQAKRHTKNIQRTVLDALRGSLHRFGAVRGTIITTGGFARGTKQAAFEPGVAPITLIDGDKLIDLMLEHEIGVRKRRVELLEVDPSAFAARAGDEADEE